MKSVLRIEWFSILQAIMCISCLIFSDYGSRGSQKCNSGDPMIRVRRRLSDNQLSYGLDLSMFYRLSYEASTGASRGNLGSESR